MGEVRLDLGAVIDVATSGDVRDLSAKVDKGFGLLNRRPKPIRRVVSGANVVPASGACVVVVTPDGPAVGKIWQITHIVVTGADDRTTVANATVAGYRGVPPSTAVGVPNLTGLIFPASSAGTANTIPLEKAYSDKTLWVHNDESVFFMVYGANVGVSVQASVECIEYDEASIEANVM